MSDPAIRRLQRALGRAAIDAQGVLERVLSALAAKHALREPGTETLVTAASAALSRVLACADLGGRLEVRFGPAPTAPEAFAARVGLEVEGEDKAVPWVAFDEAILDLTERHAYGAETLRRMGLAVEDVYGPVREAEGLPPFWRHGFALAKAADDEVARRVREKLEDALREGVPTEDVAQELATTWDFPTSYARNVVRTNLNTAQTAGRFREAEQVAAEGFPVGFRFETAGDSDVRAGHAALDGLVARVDDPLWRAWSPPLGYQCRCLLVPVMGDEVPRAFARLPDGAAKDPGFGTRQDLAIY